MVTVWGALLSFLFVLTTALSGYVEIPSKKESEQKDKSEQSDKSDEKKKSEQKSKTEQKSKSEQKGKSEQKRKSERKGNSDEESRQASGNSLSGISESTNNSCIKNCPDGWRLRQ
jgi:flagellum-specific peptidoglycan hydrolase FlgJ